MRTDESCSGRERAQRPRRWTTAHSVDGTPRSTSDLCLLSWHERAHAVSTLEGRKFGTPLAGFGERVWLREPPLERANKFSPRCVAARLLGFCLRSSRYVVVDFDGRFRFVRTVERANSEDRWAVASPRDPFSFGDLEMTPAEFTCSKGTRGEVNPAAQRLEKPPADALPRNPDHEPIPRRLYIRLRDFLAHGTSDHCPGCRALVSGGRARGYTEECRIRVEGELRKTEEGRVRLQAAATRVGDAPVGRAAKRVRFASDQVDGGAGVSTRVRIPSLKQNDYDVFMLLSDSDASQSVSVKKSGSRVDVVDWDPASRDRLRALRSDGTSAACASGGVAMELMSNEPQLLDLLAAAS